VGRRFDRQERCQEELSPGISDVGIVARRVQVLTDSGASPRVEGREMQGREEMCWGEFARSRYRQVQISPGAEFGLEMVEEGVDRRLSMLPESSSWQLTVDSWIVRMEEFMSGLLVRERVHFP
jgi:hypothetical protein